MNTQTRLAFQGMLGAYSHRAGQLYMEKHEPSTTAVFVPCASFEQVFSAVDSLNSDFGIVPLENSSVGSIAPNYDLLWHNPISISGEISMPVNHNLLAIPGANIEQIRQVYSHPVALDQCRQLFERMPQLVASPYFDTSGAACYVSEQKDPSKAAIASELAAQQYGLSVLQDHIEDYAFNSTRFGIICKLDPEIEKPAVLPAPPYKISAAVELEDKPGSLARLLTRIASLEINVTKIESRPIPDAPWHYRFFIDLELDGQDQDSSAIKVLRDSCSKYKLLGRYLPWNS